MKKRSLLQAAFFPFVRDMQTNVEIIYKFNLFNKLIVEYKPFYHACPEKSGLLHENFLLFERCPEKCFQFVERNVSVRSYRSVWFAPGMIISFLVVAFQLFERVFAEIADGPFLHE